VPLAKTFEPATIEADLYEAWEDSGVFAAADSNADPFTIVIPPPNVTGSLHMGHALNMSLQDLLTRYHRMKGHRALWQPGTDHAGIATQMVVERQLEGEGKNRHDMGRDAFIERIWQWKVNPAAPSPDSCAVWARHRIGAVSGSPWMTGCRPPSAQSSFNCIAMG